MSRCYLADRHCPATEVRYQRLSSRFPARPPSLALMVKGILLGFLAMAIFSCGDACIKAIGDRMTVFEISFFATLFACVALPFVRGPQERWRDMFRMHRPGLVMVRVVAGVFAGLFSIVAFTTLPFAEVYSLIFLSPLFVTILSIPFLGETVGWRRIFALPAPSSIRLRRIGMKRSSVKVLHDRR